MALKGDLKSINLANVLQDLASNELSGTLSIRSGDARRDFWFEKGKLRLVGLGGGKHPSPINGLLAMGKLKASDVNVRPNLTLVRGLVRKGVVAPADVRAALEHQMLEFVCDVFAWSDASFEFTEGEPDEDLFEIAQLDQEIRLAVDPIIMEALRRADEWGEIRKVIVSPAEILVVLPDRSAGEPDATIERLASFFNGERSLRDIIDETHLGDFAVFRAAAAMLRSGAARLLSSKEALNKALAALGRKQHAHALTMARYGLEREPGNLELRQVAAESLEAMERVSEAASEYRQIAAAQSERGLKEEAAATCRKILALVPRDTFTHERLFFLLIDLRKEADALQQGESLAAAYKRAGLPDKAKEVYTRLIQAFGDDDELLEAAGEVARRLGDKKEAIGLYRRLFERALARGDNDAVVQYARTIVRMDPSAEDVARRRMEVETGVYRRRKKIRRRMKVGIALAVLAAIAVGAGTYEFRARAFLRDVHRDSITLLQAKDFRSLLRRYNEFLDRYSWSLAVPDAQRERNSLEDSYLAQLPRLPVSDDQLIDALSTAKEIRSIVRQKKACEETERVLKALRDQAGDLGNRFLQEAAELARDGKPAAIARISQMTHPLAAEAVQRLASHPSAEVRRAAVEALGVSGSDTALETLVTVMATEQDPAVKTATLEHLKKKTRQDFGQDHNLWSEWLRKELASKGRVPPLNAEITAARNRIEQGQPVLVDWRLKNIGAKLEEFGFVGEVEITDASGARVPVKLPSAGGLQHVQLHPGEYIGGQCDLGDLGLQAPGIYDAEWSARVNWGGDGQVRIPAPGRLRIEIAAPKK